MMNHIRGFCGLKFSRWNIPLFDGVAGSFLRCYIFLNPFEFGLNNLICSRRDLDCSSRRFSVLGGT